MSEERHPIYGHLVYRRTFGSGAGGWFAVEGDHPLETVERQADETGPGRLAVDAMALRHRRDPSPNVVDLVARARRA